MQVNKVLETTLKANTRTIEIMDAFASMNNQNEVIYDTLAINQIFMIFYGPHRYYVDLLIQRRVCQAQYIECFTLTFTLLKNRYRGMHFSENDKSRSPLLATLFNSINKSEIFIEATEKVFTSLAFETPVEFKAQNSNNVLGFRRNQKEKLYHWNRTMYGDTPFGETTNFAIVGMRLEMLPE